MLVPNIIVRNISVWLKTKFKQVSFCSLPKTFRIKNVSLKWINLGSKNSRVVESEGRREEKHWLGLYMFCPGHWWNSHYRPRWHPVKRWIAAAAATLLKVLWNGNNNRLKCPDQARLYVEIRAVLGKW